MELPILVESANIILQYQKNDKSVSERLHDLNKLCLEKPFHMTQDELYRFEQALYLFYEYGYTQAIKEKVK